MKDFYIIFPISHDDARQTIGAPHSPESMPTQTAYWDIIKTNEIKLHYLPPHRVYTFVPVLTLGGETINMFHN